MSQGFSTSGPFAMTKQTNPTDVLAAYDGMVGGGWLEAWDKLNEARFFLHLMKQTTNHDEFRWLTSAFATASRSAIDWLATAAYYAVATDNHKWEMEPDPEALNILNKHFSTKQVLPSGMVKTHSPHDAILKKLCDERNENVHRGPLWIHPSEVTDPHDFKFGWDGMPVLKFAEAVLTKLTAIQNELHS